MRWMCGAVMVAVALLLGCGEERGLTRTYLLARADIPTDGLGVGFDLDDRVSTGETEACDDAPDQTSARGEPGIDNSFQAAHFLILPTPGPTYEDLILEQIRGGEYLVLIEVSDIDSFEHDERVGVRAYLGASVGEVLVADGMAVPDQTFVQVGAPFADLPVGSASIVGGVLRFDAPSFPLSFGSGSTAYTLSARDARVRARISDGALGDGEVGGHLTLPDLIALDPDIIDEQSIRDLGLPDLDPDPADPTICHAVSFGFSFAAVSASAGGE